MAGRGSLLACLLVCGLLIAHVTASGSKALVLLPTVEDASLYSQFLDSLRAQGITLDVKAAKDSSLKLREYGAWLYDHLVLLAPKTESFGGGVDVATITDFVDSGHNVILAASSDASEATRALASEFGVDLDDKGTAVYDHFHGHESDHRLVYASDVVNAPTITGGPLKAPVIFRGIAATVPGDSELAVVVLSAPSTAYSNDPRKAMVEPPALMVGNAISLVTAVQARNNARILVSGSLELFSDSFFDAEVVDASTNALVKSGNKAFCAGVAAWALQRSGVLVADNLRHHLLGSDEQPPLYRVNDDVEFLIDIWQLQDGKRVPYKADDVQVEFTMLDPYIRAKLTHDGTGTYSLRFKVPDVYGVFKYTIEYRKRGFSFIDVSHQVPVRPFKHNEYERFLLCAYPYYASAATSMAAFFLLGLFFLYHK